MAAGGGVVVPEHPIFQGNPRYSAVHLLCIVQIATRRGLRKGHLHSAPKHVYELDNTVTYLQEQVYNHTD